MVVSCPKRAIDLDRLGPIDVVVLSHRHPDHFDLPSLDRLSRHCQVVCARQASSVRVEAVSLPDLLMHFTIYDAVESENAAKRRIDSEISQLRNVWG